MLSMSPTMSVARAARDSIFGRAVVSVTASLLLAAGTAHIAGPPSAPPVATPRAHAATAKHSGRDAVATQERIEHCQSSGPEVWLTFDDGGSAK